MPQFTIDKAMRLDSDVTVSGSDAHHIATVLRLKPGNWIVLSDGKGHSYKGEIKTLGNKKVTITIKSELPRLTHSKITLAQAAIKHDKIEHVIQKAVELGVCEVIPFTSERTIPKYGEGASERKLERWNKIAGEAAKQCGLSEIPKVKPLVGFSELMESSKSFDHKLLFYEGENKQSIRTYLDRHVGRSLPSNKAKGPPRDDTSNLDTYALKHSSTLITIGPEGGFAANEIDIAKKHGFETLGLGPLILRVETAAIVATTLVQYSLGHFGPISLQE